MYTKEVMEHLGSFDSEELREFLVKAGNNQIRFRKGGESKQGHIYPSQLVCDTPRKSYSINARMELKGFLYGVLERAEIVADIREREQEYQAMEEDATVGYVFNGNYYNPIKKSEVNTLITESGKISIS